MDLTPTFVDARTCTKMLFSRPSNVVFLAAPDYYIASLNEPLPSDISPPSTSFVLYCFCPMRTIVQDSPFPEHSMDGPGIAPGHA